MSEKLGTVTVTDRWKTVGVITQSNARQIAVFIDRYKRDSTGIEIRMLAIEDNKSFPFHVLVNNENSVSLKPKHYHLEDDMLDAVFIELLYDIFGQISIQVRAENVGENPDEITISYKYKIFK